MRNAREIVLDWFEQNPVTEVTVQSLSKQLSMRPPTVYVQTREMVQEGLLSQRVGLVVRKNLSACKQFHFKATDRVASKPKGAVSQKGQSIVDRAIESRGYLLDAWWPIAKASNDSERAAA